MSSFIAINRYEMMENVISSISFFKIIFLDIDLKQIDLYSFNFHFEMIMFPPSFKNRNPIGFY